MKFNVDKIDNFQMINAIKTIDTHTEGEPLRIIIEGYPEIKGRTILEKRNYLTQHLDHLRQLLMYEPRGHADMYGALITEPCQPNSDFGILFMHNEGYSSMCGHGIIAAVTAAVKLEAIKAPAPDESIKIDSPAGLIEAYIEPDDETGNISVNFDNVPSFVETLSQQVYVQDLGDVDYDIAFGGAYYAFVDADTLNLDCSQENSQNLINAGRAIKHAVMQSYSISHPTDDDLSFLYGTIFYSNKTTSQTAHSKHVCIFADGELDRSPTGTGVSARAALLATKESLSKNQPIIIESITGSNMRVEIKSTCNFYDKAAVIPNVSGRAYITGSHKFFCEHDDIFPQGFILR